MILVCSVLLSIFTCPALANLLFQCNEFDPKEPTKCGTNVGKGGHNWTIHTTKTLPEILSNVVDITNVLYLDGNSSAQAEYSLSGPSRFDLANSDTLCIQYAILNSENCLNDASTGRLCDANVTLKSTTLGLTTPPERHFTFVDQGWTVANFQFDLSRMGTEKRKSLDILLHGFIVGNTNPSSPPYMGIKFIQVKNVMCTERIGPRSMSLYYFFVIFCFVILLCYHFRIILDCSYGYLLWHYRLHFCCHCCTEHSLRT